MKNNIHYAPKYFTDPTHPITINVIGCGGTGSLILPRLARLDFALRQFNFPGLHVTAFDGDIVEEHNQGRQNFCPGDIGQYKSTLLIEKINLAFGLQWEAFNQFVNPENIPLANIYITCVDDANFRMKFDKSFKNGKTHVDYHKQYYWLDTGNGKDFGQVILGSVKLIKQPKSKNYNTVGRLPTVIDIYGDITVDDNEEQQGIAGCSFTDSIYKQDLFINDAVSVQATNILWKLLKDNFITHHGVVINQKTLQQKGLIIK